MEESILQQIKDMFKAKAVFSYGSFVYKNKEPEDMDLIVVCEEPTQEQTILRFAGQNIELSFYSIEDFENKLKNHEISLLECLYLKELDLFSYFDHEVHKIIKNFHIDKPTLRKSISQKSSNSYVKAKKKILVDEDFNLLTSLKSLWHSIRIVDFGTQIAKYGFIKDYESVNHYYDEINEDYLKFDSFESREKFWQFIHNKYKPIFNNFLKEFRKFAPKENKNENKR